MDDLWLWLMPTWIAGIVMIIVGGFLAYAAEAYSWEQVLAGLFIIVGLGLFIHGVANSSKSVDEEKVR